MSALTPPNPRPSGPSTRLTPKVKQLEPIEPVAVTVRDPVHDWLEMRRAAGWGPLERDLPRN